MYIVYIINDLGKRYIGCTSDLDKRLADHNNGISKWTKRSAGQWKLIWSKNFSTLGEARSFENLLKRQKGGKGLDTLINAERSGS